jgi:hypothetical protein
MRRFSLLRRAALAVLVVGCLAVEPVMAQTNPIPGIDIVVRKQPGGSAIHLRSDDQGRIVLPKGLEPGNYEIDIEGKNLIAAMDKLAPPAAPEKKSSGGGLSIGLGGFLGGGSSRSSSSGHTGMGGHPEQSRRGSSGGGGLGLGVSIPLGGGSSDKDAAPQPEAVSIRVLSGGLSGGGGVVFATVTPYCRDTAGQGMSFGFTVPPQGNGPASIGVQDIDVISVAKISLDPGGKAPNENGILFPVFSQAKMATSGSGAAPDPAEDVNTSIGNRK